MRILLLARAGRLNQYGTLRDLLENRFRRRPVFVSYHHGGDRQFYDAFSRLLADTYDVIEDNSVERIIDSDDSEYVIRTIRENYITGSSCTVVLCGAGTPWRKFVDWEIKATLDREHGLVGINLPTSPRKPNGNAIVPDRLYDNISSGYAAWTKWEYVTQSPGAFPAVVEQANSANKPLIRNWRDLRTRNG